MTTYNVMFARSRGRNQSLFRVNGHDQIHAALVAWRRAGMERRQVSVWQIEEE